MKTEPTPSTSSAPARDPLIITRAELEKMPEAQKQAFRAAGGTVVENQALPGVENAVLK